MTISKSKKKSIFFNNQDSYKFWLPFKSFFFFSSNQGIKPNIAPSFFIYRNIMLITV